MYKNFQKQLKNYFPVSFKSALITVGILLAATIICLILRIFNNHDTYVAMLYILAVLLVSRYTEGYLFGIISSVISVLAVNFIFSYPYLQFDFSLAGYPITMLCMLVVSITTSALTTQIKQHSQIKLEAEKEKTRSNLLRAVSHDLRTPLTSILGATSAIIDNDAALNSQQRIRLLGEIKEDAQWLIRMIENLLSITRIDGERSTKIVKTQEAAEELVAEAITKFQKRFPEQNLSVKVPDDLLMIPMDAILIEQVIINLLENAVLHGKGATQIDLSVLKCDPWAVFEIRDNGCGISKEVLPHIFDGYFKEAYENDGDTKRNMGIGLSVCYTIIQAHGGQMTAYNNQNGGAVFCFKLPLEVQQI